MTIMIRAECVGDEAGIRNVHASAFPTDAEARLVDALRDSARLIASIVAIDEERIVGHVAFSSVSLDRDRNDQAGVGLAPVAVLKSHRRRGVAARLIRTGIEQCRANRAGWMVVLGDPAYYARFGFEPASSFGLIDEYGGGDAFQAMELRASAIPIGSGLVRYAPEFAHLED